MDGGIILSSGEMPSSRNSVKRANISHDSVTIPGGGVGHDLSYKYGRWSCDDWELQGRAKSPEAQTVRCARPVLL